MENIVRKGEIACNKQSSPFLTMFCTLYGTSKILSFGNGLKCRFLIRLYLSHYQTTNFRLFKLKEFADNNVIKLSKWVENTVGKGEIARYDQFHLFPHCFQKACFPAASKGVIVWEWVNPLPDNKF